MYAPSSRFAGIDRFVIDDLMGASCGAKFMSAAEDVFKVARGSIRSFMTDGTTAHCRVHAEAQAVERATAGVTAGVTASGSAASNSTRGLNSVAGPESAPTVKKQGGPSGGPVSHGDGESKQPAAAPNSIRFVAGGTALRDYTDQMFHRCYQRGPPNSSIVVLDRPSIHSSQANAFVTSDGSPCASVAALQLPQPCTLVDVYPWLTSYSDSDRDPTADDKKKAVKWLIWVLRHVGEEPATIVICGARALVILDTVLEQLFGLSGASSRAAKHEGNFSTLSIPDESRRPVLRIYWTAHPSPRVSESDATNFAMMWQCIHPRPAISLNLKLNRLEYATPLQEGAQRKQTTAGGVVTATASAASTGLASAPAQTKKKKKKKMRLITVDLGEVYSATGFAMTIAEDGTLHNVVQHRISRKQHYAASRLRGQGLNQASAIWADGQKWRNRRAWGWQPQYEQLAKQNFGQFVAKFHACITVEGLQAAMRATWMPALQCKHPTWQSSNSMVMLFTACFSMYRSCGTTTCFDPTLAANRSRVCRLRRTASDMKLLRRSADQFVAKLAGVNDASVTHGTHIFVGDMCGGTVRQTGTRSAPAPVTQKVLAEIQRAAAKRGASVTTISEWRTTAACSHCCSTRFARMFGSKGTKHCMECKK